MPNFKVVGTGYEGREKIIRSICKKDMTVELIREPENKHSSEAIAVYLKSKFLIFVNRQKIGYFPHNKNKDKILRHLDSGGEVSAKVESFYAPIERNHPRVSVKFEYL